MDWRITSITGTIHDLVAIASSKQQVHTLTIMQDNHQPYSCYISHDLAQDIRWAIKVGKLHPHLPLDIYTIPCRTTQGTHAHTAKAINQADTPVIICRNLPPGDQYTWLRLIKMHRRMSAHPTAGRWRRWWWYLTC